MKTNKILSTSILAVALMLLLVPIAFSQENSKKEEVFTIVEEQPTPKDGMGEFYKFIGENLKYPAAAKKDSVQGKVFLKFMVLESGELAHIEVIKGIGHGCDEAALNAIKNSPAWIPGKQKGKAVKVWMTLPIVFRL